MVATDVDLATAESSDEFVDGSIFRVKLHNFLTYNDAEFHPGPRLNLILGPNGTGKSSIVCALCVGLAGSTKVLGRADKVGQFVRHEKDSGFTEIEIFFERGNQVIRRNIFRDNTSTWMLNGRNSTLKQVVALMETANIQISNLCQFLPQDKVGEFSRMNPMQLLKATESAIMDGELAVRHDELVEMQNSMRDKTRDLEQSRAALEQKKTECQHLETEVERIVDYETRIKETELMEKKCLWLQFEEEKRQVDELKEDKKRCREEMDKAKEERVAPLENLLEEEVEKLEQLKSKKVNADQDKREVDEKIKRQKQLIETTEDLQAKTLTEIKELRNHHNQSRKRLEKLEHDVEGWKRERAAMPEENDLKVQKSHLEKEQREREMEHAEISSKRQVLVRKLATVEDEANRVMSKLKQLDNEDVQRKLALQRFDPDAIRAADWVKRNQHLFKRKVWGPVVLEMKVNEALHAKYVEDILPKWMMTALVVESKADYDTILTGLQNEGQRTKVSVVIVENGMCGPIKRPYSDEQMRVFRERFGITGYLDELVTAPDVIHEALRANGGVNTVLIGTHQTEDMINNNEDVFSAFANSDRSAAFVTPFKKYVTSVSKYGARNVTTRTNDLRDPRLLGASSSNEDEKNRLKDTLEGFSAEQRHIQEEIESLKAQERQFGESRNNSMRRINEIRSQLKTMIRLDEKIGEADNKIYSLRSELARDLSDKEEAMGRKLKNQGAKQGRQIKECLKLTQELLKCSARDATITLLLSAQQVRVELTEKELKRTEATIKALQDAYRMAKENLMAKAKQAMKLKKRAEREAPLSEYEEQFATLSEDLEELEGKIENNRRALDCFRGDISVRDRYQQLVTEIEQEEATMQALEGDVNSGEDRISGIKNAWHASLQRVIARIDGSFKEFFQDIGCVGEIVLDDQDPDISKWGIQRRAQFRKNTKLSTMTAEEQSGGEKSVGTIMYLMALQNLTKCPFRVVDEINQGMDVYNERKVFQRITKSSCGSKMPQYFLITPKLITGLTYHRDTKVMVILNGPWNKVRQEMWDADRFIASAKHSKRHRVANGNGDVDLSRSKRVRT